MPLLSSDLGAPHCEKCGAKLIVVEDCGNGVIVVACMYCDMPQDPMSFHYDSVCWRCGESINSDVCEKSEKPGGGWKCTKCSADLYDWKVMRGILNPYRAEVNLGH